MSREPIARTAALPQCGLPVFPVTVRTSIKLVGAF